MQRFLKLMAWLAVPAVLVLSRDSARAFVPEGPIGNGPDGYQTLEIGYNIGGLDLSACKALGQEFRRNTPVMYYASDGNFFGYFGTQGRKALDQAFAVYNAITNVNLYTTNLDEFPLSSERINTRAAALLLTDLKSVTMGLMTEQLGLWQPVRGVWVLRLRFTLPGAPPCPAGELYDVMQRNSPVAPTPDSQPAYSSYVNGTLYSYFIFEDCGRGSPPAPVSDAEEFPVSPIPDTGTFTAVADWDSLWYTGLIVGSDGFGGGGYYTGLTRDDVAGLRYLLSTNNYNPESAGSDTFQFDTNAQPAIITNQDLSLFAAQAATNGPAALTALYPGLIINTVSNTFGRAITTNITVVLTNSPFDPAGTLPSHPFFTTNYTTNVTTFFIYNFGNVVTNAFSTRGLVGSISLGLTNSPFAPAGTPPTVVTNARFTFVNGIFGSFFLLPTNSPCAVDIISNIFTQTIYTTNAPTGLLTLTNTTGTGGGGTTTSNTAVVFTPGTISVFTNSTVVYLPVTCPTNTVATRQGVGKLTFIRRDFDSLINQNWDPVTNDYTLYALTNGFIVPQHIRRVVTTPDFLFTASDIGTVQGSPIIFGRNVNFDTANTPAGAAGPGTIDPPSTITFNAIDPLFLNTAGGIAQNQTLRWIWGSFDGSTNDPVVYPNGVSLAEVESAVLGPFIVTTSVPNGSVGVDYSASLTGTGGQPPYTWTMSPGSALPSELTLSADGQITGTPAGPAATYDFSIRITDSAGNFNDVPYTLTISP